MTGGSPPPSGQTSGGDGHRDGLPPELYRELREIAAALLRRERSGHTLQPTALAHEAFLRLRERIGGGWDDRDIAGLRALAATAMRRILVDHARRRGADKRGAGWLRVAMPEATIDAPEPLELLALNEALEALALFDERKAKVVELRFFGGLTGDEVADAIGTARSTVEADWFLARAWLRQRLAGAV
jgi:RNA polymerase sigma factor (TIGR02999 family)